MGRRNISGFSVYTLLVLTLLLLTTTEEMGAEARTCETASNRFKGICVSSRNCAAVCNTEGFPEGDCKGFRRRCFCTRPCLEGEVKN